MRTYPITCPSCNGSGYIRNPELGMIGGTSCVLTVSCPACGGNKWVICSETEPKL